MARATLRSCVRRSAETNLPRTLSWREQRLGSRLMFRRHPGPDPGSIAPRTPLSRKHGSRVKPGMIEQVERRSTRR